MINQAEDVKGARSTSWSASLRSGSRTSGSPLTLESVMRGTLSRVAPQVMAQQMVSNRFSSNAAFSNDRGGAAFDESERAGPSALETAP